MFLEQQDLALFMGIFLGGYAVFAILRETGKWKELLLKLIPIVTIMCLIAVPTAWQVYKMNVSGVDVVNDQADSRQRWEFCTQWSVPPWESIDFVAPGFSGWRSGEPTGPYWGGTGRSADWERTRQGFRNFRLEGTYIGAIPIMFALYALFLVLAMKMKRGGNRSDIIFWSIAAVIALLLSFGKHFPLYRLFYQLPIVSSIRNPNKFLHVFQMAVGILAAYGLHYVVPRDGESAGQAKRRRVFVVMMTVCGVLMLAAGMMASLSSSGIEEMFTRGGWGDSATVMRENLVRSLVHGGIIALIGVGGLALLSVNRVCTKGFAFPAVGVVMIAIMAVDLLLLSDHYVQSVKTDMLVGDNSAVSFLRENAGNQRVLLLSQQGFYNSWLTYLFPYQGIRFFNVTQMPRMPADYKQFLSIERQNPFRLWQLASVGYIVTPVQILSRLWQDPVFREQVEPVYGFSVTSGPSGLKVLPARDLGAAQHVILRMKSSLPRYGLYESWEIVPDDQACSRLASSQFDPTTTVLVSSKSATGLPDPMPVSGGTVEVLASQAGLAELRVVSKGSTVLMAVQKYSPDWHATVNGVPVEVVRCNYLCLGVPLPPGEHKLILKYAPARGHLWVQGVGMVACALASVFLLLGAFRDRKCRRDDETV